MQAGAALSSNRADRGQTTNGHTETQLTADGILSVCAVPVSLLTPHPPTSPRHGHID